MSRYICLVVTAKNEVGISYLFATGVKPNRDLV